MQEKDFQTTFNHWCRARLPKKTAVFELKITKLPSLAFDRLEEHQKNALLVCKHASLIHKLPDAGYQNPFDSMMIAGAEAYVVVMFYHRGQKEFFMIDIDAWVTEEESSDRKSLTEERAREIGTAYILE